MSDSEDEIFVGPIGLKEWKIIFNKPSKVPSKTNKKERRNTTIGIDSMSDNSTFSFTEDKENVPSNFLQEVKNTLFDEDELVPDLNYASCIEDKPDLSLAVMELHKEIDEKLESTESYITLNNDSTKYMSIKQESFKEIENNFETIEILDETEDVVFISSEEEVEETPIKTFIKKENNSTFKDIQEITEKLSDNFEEKIIDNMPNEDNCNKEKECEKNVKNIDCSKQNIEGEVMTLNTKDMKDLSTNQSYHSSNILAEKENLKEIAIHEGKVDNERSEAAEKLYDIPVENVNIIESFPKDIQSVDSEVLHNFKIAVPEIVISHSEDQKNKPLINDSFQKLLQNESYENYMINNEIKTLIDTLVVTDDEDISTSDKTEEVCNLSTITENEATSNTSSNCFNDTLEEMEMFLKQHENKTPLVEPENVTGGPEKELKSNTKNIQIETFTPPTKVAKMYSPSHPKNLKDSSQKCTKNLPGSTKRYFATPTKASNSNFKIPPPKSVTKMSKISPFKDIISPVGVYIKTNPVPSFVRKNIGKEFVQNWEPLPESSVLVSPAKQSPKQVELPMRFYRPAGKELLKEKEDLQKMPENIQKLLKGAMETEIVKHDGRLKNDHGEESFSAFDDTACLNTDHDDISILKSSKGIKF